MNGVSEAPQSSRVAFMQSYGIMLGAALKRMGILSRFRAFRLVFALLCLVAGIAAFAVMSEWPGLHIDAALFSTPIVHLAKGEGWKFHGYLYRLTKLHDGVYASHSLIYPLIFGLLLRASSYEKILFWSSVVNCLAFVGYFFALVHLLRGVPFWPRFWKSLLLAITAGMISEGLQGRPEQLVPLIMLLPLVIVREETVKHRHGFLVLAATHGLTFSLLGLLSPLTALVYGVGALGWMAYSFKAKEIRAPIWRMVAVAAATSGIVIAIVFSFCNFSLPAWFVNTFLYGSADPSANLVTRLREFFGLEFSFIRPFWNLPVLLAFLLLLFQLAGQSRVLVFILVGLISVPVVKAAQSYTYLGFAPLILALALGRRLPVGIAPLLSRTALWASYGYTVIYSLVFARTLLLLSIYFGSGLPYGQARSEIRELTRDRDVSKEAIAYFWMRRPSFVLMDDDNYSWVTAESSIFKGKDGQLRQYEAFSGKRVVYIVYPQLGHVKSPPAWLRNGDKNYRLVRSRWTRDRAKFFGIPLGGSVPGYYYALYKLVTPSG